MTHQFFILKDRHPVPATFEEWAEWSRSHNKVIVIDADTPHATTITGSYNFTIAAQRGNAENVIILRDNAPVARAYRDNWLRRKADAAAWSDAALR